MADYQPRVDASSDSEQVQPIMCSRKYERPRAPDQSALIGCHEGKLRVCPKFWPVGMDWSVGPSRDAFGAQKKSRRQALNPGVGRMSHASHKAELRYGC